MQKPSCWSEVLSLRIENSFVNQHNVTYLTEYVGKEITIAFDVRVLRTSNRVRQRRAARGNG